MFGWLVFLVAVVWTLSFWYRRRHMYKLASVIPGPKDESLFFGVAHTLLGSSEKIMNNLQRYSYESMQHDGMLKGWLGHLLYFMVLHPADVKMVLKICLEKDDLHKFLRNVVGYGGIFAPVPIWRHRRKIMVPAFSAKMIESFMPVFAEQSIKLVKQLKEYSGKGKFNIFPFLSSYTLDSIYDTAFGVKLNAQENPDSPFLNAMSSVLNLVFERMLHPWLQPDWMYRLFPQYKKHEKGIKVLRDLTHEGIRRNRKELKLGESTNKVDHEYALESYKRTTLLDILVHPSSGEKGYTDVELREELLTLIVAGTDTSAVAMGFTLQLLSKYPEVQEKVYQELCDVFDGDRLLVKEDLPKLKYLERVVKETIRLFPPVPFIIRKVLEDLALPSGRVLPAGSGVLCSIWGAHRDPKYWGPDADKFDPDRFLPERFKLAHSCSYMPFSNGRRNCVGYQYAMMSVKTALATILRSYQVVEDREIGPTPNIRVKVDIMLKAVDGYQVAFERREGPKTMTSLKYAGNSF